MKIHKDCQIEKACSTDATRPGIQEPFLDMTLPGASKLIATNGRIMAILPVVTDDHDVAGYVPTAGIKQARKLAKRSDLATLAMNGNCTLSDGVTMPRNGLAGESTFPAWSKVIPELKGHTCRVAFDASQLALLASAMGTDGVILEFGIDDTGKADHSAIHVRPCATGHNYGSRGMVSELSAKGVIMPVRFE